MSVPQIRFTRGSARRVSERQPAKPNPDRPRTSSIPRAPVQVKFSSDSDSDDLPSIQTSTTSAISLDDEETQPPVKPVHHNSDWTPKTPRPANFLPRQTAVAPTPPSPSPSPPTPPPAPTTPPVIPSRNVPSSSLTVSDESDDFVLHSPPSSNRECSPSVQPVITPPAPFTYVTVREARKMVKKNGAEYCFMDHDNAVYFANTLKDEEGGNLGIAERPFTDPTCEVIAVVRKQGRGKRAQVIDRRLAKPYDDRPPEVLGLSQVTLPENRTKARTLRVVLPKGIANYPMTEARELAQIAKAGEPNPTTSQFVNRVPTIGPDGLATNPFGNVYLVDSVKNFVFYDDSNELLFMVYKSAEGTFNVKGKEPFTPLTAFALSLAIISS